MQKLVQFASVGATLVMCTAFAPAVVHADATTSNVTVTVNAAATLASLPKSALGVNTAAWDKNLTDSTIPRLLRNINVGALRFPGGSTADNYDWETGLPVNPSAGGANAQDNFDAFMNVANQSGASPIITVNYGSNFAGTGGGDPQEAAAWVKYANVTHHDNVKYWEIGNEVYGNGTYGSSWEVDLHSQHGPQAYAENVIQYSKAMKAVDPNIKIGVVLTCPYNWPWGVESPADWNKTVLQTLNQDPSAVDFVIVHWYAQNPGSESDSGLLSSTSQIPSMMAELRNEIATNMGSEAANRLKVFVTETNSVSYNPGKQTTNLVNALFLDDDMMSWLQAGASNVDWWALHDSAYGGNASSDLYGNTTYGDYGLLSSGSSTTDSSGTTVTEPPANTPFPSYYGFQMAGALVQPGSTMVGSSSSNPMVAVHAVKMADGQVGIMLINKDPNQTYNVSLNTEGFHANGPTMELTYGEGSQDVSSQMVPWLGSTISLKPYSVTDLVLGPKVLPNLPFSPVSDTTTVSNSTVPPGSTQTISTSFTSKRPLRDVTLDQEIYSSSGQLVGQNIVPQATLSPGQSKMVTWNWTAPNAPDTYSVKTFVFSQMPVLNTLLADQNSATFNVTVPSKPTFSGSVTVSSSSVKVGTPVNISGVLTNTSTGGYLNSGIADLEIHDSSNTQVWQVAPTVNLNPGQSYTVSGTWTPKQPGTYQVDLGAFSGGWGTNYYFGTGLQTITVTN